MIVDRLVIHHTYDGSTAVDVSQNHNHGHLEGVTLAGGVAELGGGADCVRVRVSPTLAKLRAVRCTVRFRLAPGPWIDPGYSGGPRRQNLIEGYLSFALAVGADRSIGGSIVDANGAWTGAQSSAGVVSHSQWHEVTFVHDGFSACRVDLDGTTVAESFDVLGPVRPPNDLYGIAIGHWPDPDDRYSFIGEIDDVKVWIDRLDSVRDTVDGCCVDRGAIDDLFDDLRGADLGNTAFDPAAYQAAGQTMADLGSKTFGAIAAGTEADRVQAWDLSRRFLLAFGAGDRQGFVETMAGATRLAAQKIPAATLQADSAALIDSLRPTVLGPLVDVALGGGDAAQIQAVARKLGIDQWVDAFCHGWVNDPPPGGKSGDGHDSKGDTKGNGDRTGPATTDRDPDAEPPSWGTDAGPHHDEAGDNG